MNDKHDARSEPNENPQPRRYRSPQLLTYGLVRNLTANGSGTFIENTGKDFQPTKRL